MQKGQGMRRDLVYGEESGLVKGFYGVARTRIVGIRYLLVPQDLQELGRASTPSLLLPTGILADLAILEKFSSDLT